MEGGNQRGRTALICECGFDSRLHLLGGLVGKGDRENLLGPYASLFYQVDNATGDDSRFARACAREDQHRAIDCLDSFSLLWIELI
jgi:hypothetical protein